MDNTSSSSAGNTSGGTPPFRGQTPPPPPVAVPPPVTRKAGNATSPSAPPPPPSAPPPPVNARTALYTPFGSAADPLNSIDFGGSPSPFASQASKAKASTGSKSTQTTEAKDQDERELDPAVQGLRELWDRWKPKFQDMPSWMISTVIHVAVILLMALIPLHDEIGDAITLIVGMAGEAEVDSSLSSFEINDSTFEDSPIESVESMVEANPEITDLSLDVPVVPTLVGVGPITPSAIRSGLTGRTGHLKDTLLKAYGGNGTTEDAVKAGLTWLAYNQRSDGSWSLRGPYSNGSETENLPSATAMALLAFMGAGHTHKTGEYRHKVESGMAFLKSLQDDDGYFAAKAFGNHRTYAQAQCTIAVCELYGMTGDSEIREFAQRAVRYAEKSQDEGGGWRYEPRSTGDMSVTGWYVMALISARMAGLDVNSETLERVNKFLDTVQRYEDARGPNPDGERYAYQAYSSATPAMSAEGMLCRMYLGWKSTDPRITRGSDYLCTNLIEVDMNRRSYYYWYYATTALHHVGGRPWHDWNQAMKTNLPTLQVKSGKEKGSWPPQGDPHGSGAGRLYSTCFAIYCLESYYRHLPLSELGASQSKK